MTVDEMTSAITSGETSVDDVHSRLNRTRVLGVVRPESTTDIRDALASATRQRVPVIASGGRHAMGGQQFRSDGVVLDLRGLDRILELDAERGLVRVEAGIEWPALIDGLGALQPGHPFPWTIRQKQTGADKLTIGGAIAANAHGRGLTMAPLVSDVESLTVIVAQGAEIRCSRDRHADLFSRVIGGYGLFGVVTEATLRLRRREMMRREVEILDSDVLIAAFERRIADGFEYGDFQFAIDPESQDFLRRGVFACYRQVGAGTPQTKSPRELSSEAFADLLLLAHTDKSAGFERYADHYRSTSGQVYASDLHQLAAYPDGYHSRIDARLGHQGSEMITEIYVPRRALTSFLADARRDFRKHDVDLIYGTIRLIEKDAETALPWAREAFACVIFNLHVRHDRDGRERAGESFRRLIDSAIRHRGSYYLTYHRFATAGQVEACHPRFREFLAAKRRYDPRETLQSDWYCHYRDS